MTRAYRDASEPEGSMTNPSEAPINCAELAILHGQQVIVTFKRKEDALALFNELKRRSGGLK